MVILTEKSVSTREATERLIKIPGSTYAKAYLKQVAYNSTQMNVVEINQLLRILNYFKDFFDGTLGDWDTEPVNMELNAYSKPFNCKYYPVPIINKNTFCHKIKRSVKIGVLTALQQS